MMTINYNYFSFFNPLNKVNNETEGHLETLYQCGEAIEYHPTMIFSGWDGTVAGT